MSKPLRQTRVRTADGVELHAEVTGHGPVLLFLHEFGGDHRSWEPQVRHFGRAYTCVTFAARGYPPSSVPADPRQYSQQAAVGDAVTVLDHLGTEEAHVVGLSMGGFAALHLAMRHPDRIASLVAAACGWGSEPGRTAAFRAECHRIADAYDAEGARSVAQWYSQGPARVQLQNKDPQRWREFREVLAEHDAVGAALTMRGVQAGRPPLYELTSELAAITAPTLIVTGDEDDGCLQPALLLKRTITSSGLVVLPKTGHTCNLEDPAAFNREVDSFLSAAVSGAWQPRDPRSRSASWTGVAAEGPS